MLGLHLTRQRPGVLLAGVGPGSRSDEILDYEAETRTFEDIQRYRVTKFLGVPTIYKSLARAGKEKKPALSSLQVCAIGGEKATPEMMARFREAGFPLRQIMGQTETSILLWASEEDVIRKPGSVGRPVFHAEVERVLREHPEVEDAVVVGIADEVWGEAGHAFVIRKAEGRLSSEALRE